MKNNVGDGNLAQCLSKIVSILLPALAGLLMASCATDQAAKMRAERKTTVGSDLISSLLVAEYRPAENYGVDFAYRKGVLGIQNDLPPSLLGATKGPCYPSLDSSCVRSLYQTSMNSFTAAGSWYPWATSAFRVGAGLTYSTGVTSFNSPQANADATWSQVKYKRSSTYLNLPFGWNWIFETLGGFTLGWDYALNYRMLNSSSLTESGGSTIDTADRDAYFKRFENNQKVVYGSVLSHIGWSF